MINDNEQKGSRSEQKSVV